MIITMAVLKKYTENLKSATVCNNHYTKILVLPIV